MKRITYSKHVSKCPHCGKKMYYRVCIDGIELNDDMYGICYNKNSNCFPLKNQSKHFTFSLPKIKGNQTLADNLLADAYDAAQDQPSIPYKITTEDISAFHETRVTDNTIYGDLTVDIIDSMRDYGVMKRTINMRQKDGSYKEISMIDYWYVDILGNYRDCKSMAYTNGHRDKTVTPMWGRQTIAYHHISRNQRYMSTAEIQSAKEAWLHNHDFNLCLFGEQLLAEYPNRPVFLFEAEKTAIVVNAYLKSIKKDAVCLAAGCKGRMSKEYLNNLGTRNVFIFPDTDDTKIAQRFEGANVRIIEWWKPNYSSVMAATALELYDCTRGQDIVQAKLDFADILAVRLKQSKAKECYNNDYAEPTINYSAATW